MGEMPVPADALYGASTARAVANFPIAKEPVPAAVIHAFGHLKAACAAANLELGRLDATRAEAIIAAADEVAAGQHDAHFPVDIYQTGSGTSTNMNGNEVIANLANQKLGFGLSAKNNPDAVHPNDHVNAGQSSNDTFPTGMHIAGALAIENDLKPALDRLRDGLAGQGRGLGQDREDRPHAPDGRHPHPRGSGVCGLRPPGRARPPPRGLRLRGHAAESGDRRHGRGHGHQHAPRVCRQGVRRAEKTHGHRLSRRPSSTPRPRPPRTASCRATRA